MRPRLTAHDSHHATLRDAELSPDVAIDRPITPRRHGANRAHILNGQLLPTKRIAPVLPNGVVDVVALRADAQVIRIHALWNVTGVHDHQAVRNGTVRQLICQPMRRDAIPSSADGDVAVLWIGIPARDPAGRRLCCACREQFGWCILHVPSAPQSYAGATLPVGYRLRVRIRQVTATSIISPNHFDVVIRWCCWRL